MRCSGSPPRPSMWPAPRGLPPVPALKAVPTELLLPCPTPHSCSSYCKAGKARVPTDAHSQGPDEVDWSNSISSCCQGECTVPAEGASGGKPGCSHNPAAAKDGLEAVCQPRSHSGQALPPRASPAAALLHPCLTMSYCKTWLSPTEGPCNSPHTHTHTCPWACGRDKVEEESW